MTTRRPPQPTGSGWPERKAQLKGLLKCCGDGDDEEEEGVALDRILCGGVKDRDGKRREAVEAVRFSDRDLSSFGPLAEAQFGTVSDYS